ncbi:MAG: metallophosphoesterase [Chitinophagaceae bacterium]|nr:MAG: metallophosphoesterase [Chitinophagaceae bacterium]
MLNRRNFLRNVGLTGSVLAVPPAILASPGTPATQTPASLEIILRGRVTGGGQGIAGIAVSDGSSVVATNEKGEYEFPSTVNTEFVFISIPSGYEIPAKDGIPEFYRQLKKPSGTVVNDFELEKLAGDDSKHVLVVWADTQMATKEDAAQLRTKVVPDLKELLGNYPQGTQFVGLGCGDLIWDKFEIFSDYREAVAQTGIPFYNLIGNHDLDFDARSDENSAITFKRQFGPTWYSFNRGAVHYIMLDNVFFVGVGKKYIGYLSEQQLLWLEQDLALVKKGATVIVGMHIPTATGLFKRQKKEEEFGMFLCNRKQLYRILQPYQVHIMSGHTHFNENWEQPGIMEHNHGAVCGAWWTGPICSDGTPAGYGVYEIDGTDVRWYYKSTGFTRDKQFRIYQKGRVKEFPAEIAVNVWNWDPKWKVEWLEAGVVKGNMVQRVGMDPWAVELYEGKELPVKQKWVEPTLNDHLFFARPSAGARQVTIRVTDRFGKVYEENV